MDRSQRNFTDNNRLKPFLRKIIHEAHVGFIPGRNAFDHAFLLSEVVDYARKHQNNEGSIIIVDQQKAYNRVSMFYLFQCLTRLGFNLEFCSWISMLIVQLSSSLFINGYLSLEFDTLRGLRQGDPLSPHLYAIALQPLIHELLVSMQGYKLCRKDIKLLAFADDLVLFPKNANDISLVIRIFDIYNKASNAQLKKIKTQLVPFNMNTRNDLLQFQTTFKIINENEIFAYLGYPFKEMILT
ncbi:Reverse transcriptase domain-containing protein [Rozella allomycis CSF55]|uniref:Reverse transcriptase domain-containing protein n=1 Tax=Rozella allomycis (strain CSF55) TaxID=988480 RepID=A0A075AVA8_ROZAC|nr:Reverse transcriptase domain-containing protein [Rozella allomycis CSF55]|eukprot:EPZ34188.1 Reverse transcriptase domain-containing protein [Rozella allomycis CSF55]